MTTAAIIHFDITGPDDEVLRRFYGEVFTWTVDAKGPGYALVTTPQLRGAIVEGAPSITLGVAVTDLTTSVETAVSNGATVVMPPTDNGWVTKAQIADPCGNIITLIQS
jgi:predicted enzyme related to lactoylglutathione lyase